MNKIEKLLQELCPNGVQWEALGKVAKYEQPTPYIVKSTNYNDYFKIPVLTAGKTLILGYTDEKEGVYKASAKPVIIFDDFTTANKWIDFDFKVKSSAMKMITTSDEKKYSQKYIYYWLNTLPNIGNNVDHKRQWIGVFAKKNIPIPPIEVQREIVKILDNFTELTAELTTELTARQKQYTYYRDQLLNFDPQSPDKRDFTVEWKALGEVCDIGDGLHGTPRYNALGKYFFINGNNLNNGNIVFNDKTKKVDELMYEKHGILFLPKKTIFLSINGTIGSIALYNYEQIVLGKSVAYFIINDSGLKTKYLYYFLQTSISTKYFENNKTGSTIKNLGLKALRAFKIPIPPLAEQERIVSILDKFDTLVNSISEGLPKEIALRQKQYEYYREKLLSFKKLGE